MRFNLPISGLLILQLLKKMNNIHPTAIIEDGAVLGEENHIGPYCLVGKNVNLGSNNVLRSHVIIEGKTYIGNHNSFFQFSSIGTEPQDLKYHQEETTLYIGDNNTFRENTSVHRGTVTGHGTTKIGNTNLFMGYVHVAHDCVIGNNNILANYTGLSGHVTIDDYVTLGGQNGVIQFVHIGSHCYFGAGTMIDKSIAPYITGYGNRIQIKGINLVGLKRRGYSREAINAMLDAHKIFFRSDKKEWEALESIEEKYKEIPEVMMFVNFIRNAEGGVKK